MQKENNLITIKHYNFLCEDLKNKLECRSLEMDSDRFTIYAIINL